VVIPGMVQRHRTRASALWHAHYTAEGLCVKCMYVYLHACTTSVASMHCWCCCDVVTLRMYILACRISSNGPKDYPACSLASN
jgi:hypothetical protein